MPESAAAFTVTPKELGFYDLIVAGGGPSGTAAAVSAARNGLKVLLIEGMGSLGGALTCGLILHLGLDRGGKGGIVNELFEFLNQHGMTCPRRGDWADENGQKLPGDVVNPDGVKIFFDKLCRESGVEVIFYSHVIAVEHHLGHIRRLLIGSECGPYTASAKLYVDATGNGTVAQMAGCSGEYGQEGGGNPQPCTMSYLVHGLGFETSITKKKAYGEELAQLGLHLANPIPCALRTTNPDEWLMWTNYEFNVDVGDIRSLSRATAHGRMEALEVLEAHRREPRHAKITLGAVCEHLGVREGCRIKGLYHLTVEDLLAGRRFPDGICLAGFLVDVHRPAANQEVQSFKAAKVLPYHIPYRALVPVEADNLLLAGRLISGDFQAHASYRVICNMLAVGEAAGFAANLAVKNALPPREVDGVAVNCFMKSRGYTL